MVSTIKFSEFASADLNSSTNKTAGLSGGVNATTEIVVRWTTAGRPSAPFNGLLGYNTDLSEYEYWDSVTADWFQLGTGDTGTVTLVQTGTGLTGGPITDTGTISFSSIAANSFWANTTGVAAVPAVTALSLFLLSANNLSDVPNKAAARTNLGLEIGVNVEAWNAVLDTIAGLGKVPLNLGGTNASLVASVGGIFYSTATAGAILAGTAIAGQILQSGASAAPTWSTASYPSTAGSSGNILTSDGVNFSSLPPAGIGSPLTTKGDLYTFSTINARLAVGTTNGQVLQVSSGATTGLAYSTASYPTVATGTGTIMRANGTNWVSSTSTFADTYLINTIPFAATANTITGTSLSSIIDASIGTTQGNILYRNASAWVVLAPGTSGQFLQTLGAGANVQWAPGDGAGTVTSITQGTGITLTPNPITSSGTIELTVPVVLANGGTGASLVASNGGIFYSTATAGAILAGTATAGQILRSGLSSAPSWSTTTYPSTNAINTLLYASSANVMSALATANSGVLVTDSGGIPSISSNLPAGINLPSPFSVNSTSVTSTGTQLNFLNGLTVVPINKVAVQVFIASGTYTPTTGMKYAIVEVVGGGGGGGGSAGAAGQSGGAGGGSAGAYARSVLTAATIGASQSVTIGALGTGGAAGTNDGNPGNTCTFGALVSASGGAGGRGAASVAGAAAVGAVAGGSTATGNFTSVGSSGNSGFVLLGSAGTVVSGAGGSSIYGQGGRNRTSTGAGLPALGYGSGGGGAVGFNGTASIGGDGTLGVVVVTEYISS